MTVLRYMRALIILLAFGLSLLSAAGPSEDAAAAYGRGEYATALRIWGGLAEQGNAEAQAKLGGMYRDGRGVAKDDAEAVAWFRKAAEQGYATAQTNLGLMYARGQGVPRDDIAAVQWYRKAAEQGFAWGQTNIGYMYAQGRGVAKDDAEAVQWYRKATEQGFAMAQDNLGVMYRDGRGVTQDHVAALDWFRKAAEQGYAEARTNLGFMYETGRGVAKDDAEAVQWYRKAAAQGNALGQSNLGNMYRDGRGVVKDDAEAVQWYRKAATQGSALGQANLGTMYRDGRGVAKDDAEAVQWYRKAAEQGNAAAQSTLGYMYANGRGVAKDDAEAVQWYRKAAAQGDTKAQTLLNSIVDGTAVTKTYAVVSMVGSRLSFVTRKFSTGDRLDHYDRRAEALPDDTIAATVLGAMANAVREVAPATKTDLLEIELPASRGNESVGSEELLAVARQALRNIVGGRSWDFIVLLGPRRAFAEAHLMGSNLEGLGFYVDPGTSEGFRPLRVPGDIVKADRFISPFVSSQVWLLDAKTLDVVATQSIYGYCRYISAKGDALDPWRFFDSEKMLKMLTLVIQHDVGESTKTVLRKGLGMPEVPAREHVEFCTHRYD